MLIFVPEVNDLLWFSVSIVPQLYPYPNDPDKLFPTDFANVLVTAFATPTPIPVPSNFKSAEAFIELMSDFAFDILEFAPTLMPKFTEFVFYFDLLVPEVSVIESISPSVLFLLVPF